MSRGGLSRRTFISGAVVAGLTGAFGFSGSIRRRRLGRTGWQVSVIGFGGAHIAGTQHAHAERAINLAIDLGINYLDTASSYGDSELKIGEVLRTRRSEVYIATKVLKRTGPEAREELNASFERLGVDVIDLVQIHSVSDLETLDLVTQAGGPLEVIEEARKAGKVRFVGITGHRRADVLVEALNRYPFATVLAPVSPADALLHDFEPILFPVCRKLDVGILAMKPLAAGHLVGRVSVTEALGWVLSREGIACAVVGMKNSREVETDIVAALDYRPVSKQESDRILAAARPVADSKYLWWKR